MWKARWISPLAPAGIELPIVLFRTRRMQVMEV